VSELRDLRIKITAETDCALQAYALAHGKSKGDVVRDILHAWALAQIDEARHYFRLRERPPRQAKRQIRGVAKRAAIFKRAQGCCAYCGETLDPFSGWAADHVVPTSRGGGDDDDNLVAACVTCNVRKGAMSAAEFRHSLVSADGGTSGHAGETSPE
jgi:hypothetical protein